MVEMSQLASGWWWLAAGFALAIAEILLPGVFLIWLGAAALLTGILSLALGLPTTIEVVIFAVAAVAAVFAGRRWFALNPIETSDPLLNDRGARLIGETVVVCEAIAHGKGRVRVGDGVWPAEGEDAAIGTTVRVAAMRGGTLVVVTAA